MKIDLREVKTVCISGVNSTERRDAIKRHTKTLEMKNWSFFDADTVLPSSRCKIRGCALSHLEVISQHDFKEPLLVLEDDAEPTEEWKPVIEVPDETDAVYLGNSWWLWGAHRAAHTGKPSKIQEYGGKITTATATSIPAKWYKINRTSGAHAILYITEQYAKAVCEQIQWRLDLVQGSHLADCDIAMADVQERFVVISPRKPYIFQGPEETNANRFWTVWQSEKYPGGRLPPLDQYCAEVDRWRRE